MESQQPKQVHQFFPSVGIKVTCKCEYNCPFCCEPSRGRGEYPVENFITILDIIAKHGTRRVCFTGGDPLLHPDIPHILERAQRLGLESVLLTANGRLFCDSYERIAKFLDSVRFSVHGIGESHDKIVKCSGSFLSIERALSLLRGSLVKRYVTVVVTSSTIKSVKNILEWCITQGVTKLYLFGLMKSGKGAQFISSHGIVSGECIDGVINEISEIAREAGIEIVYYDFQNNAECILIYGDGDIIVDPYPDAPTYQMNIGNLFYDTIEDINKKFSTDPSNKIGYAMHYGRKMCCALPNET